MATTTHKVYGTPVTILSTQWDSLGSGSYTALSTAWNNTSNLDPFADFDLNMTSTTSSRSGAPYLAVYAVISYDAGVTYPPADANGELVGYWSFATGTASYYPVSKRDWNAPALYVKFYGYNGLGVTMPASGTTTKLIPHALQTV